VEVRILVPAGNEQEVIALHRHRFGGKFFRREFQRQFIASADQRERVVARIHEFIEVPNVPFPNPPALLPRAAQGETAWADAGVIPGDGWPEATKHWWDVISTMPHCTLWTSSDWAFAQATAECHARFAEGWKGYTGGELRQREKLLGVFLDARRDLRIKYVDPPADQPLPADVPRLDDYRAL